MVFIINATNPDSGLQRFCQRVSGVQYFLEHNRGYFYVLTNAHTSKCKKFSGSGYYLARCEVEDAQSANLKDIVVPGNDMCLYDMEMFDGHLVLFLTKDEAPLTCSIDMPIDFDCEKELEIDDLDPWYFPSPSDMFSITEGSNLDFTSTVYRAVLWSPLTPDHLCDYDMSRRTFSIVRQEDVRNTSADAQDSRRGLDWNDLSKYTFEEKEVISHDGVRIPMSILYSRVAYKTGQSPGLLHAYGAYGEVLDKGWCSDRLSLLDRGWLFAFADVRGGAGPDPSWHKQGRGSNKLNSIQDFISCAEFLASDGLIHKDRLSAEGTSAGCLLVGAAINMRPRLFRAAILHVPFLDVLNSLLDPSLPLTTLDYEEFGNPEIESCFQDILKYSPYDNIPQGACFPPVLVSASFNDTRVGVWEAAKWVAKLRDATCPNCSSAVILQTSMDEGHFRGGGRFGHCRETAYDYAFLVKAMEPVENM